MLGTADKKPARGASIMRLIRAMPECALLFALYLASSAHAQPSDSIEQKRRWVESVTAENYFFWERYFYRLSRKGETDLDEAFFQPNEVVNGTLTSPLPRAPKASASLKDGTWDSVTSYAFNRNSTGLVMMRHGQVEYETWAPGHNPGTIERVGSFAKTLLPLLIGIAIQDGTIRSVDEPVGTYIDEWKDDPRGQITIRHLLQGVSGLEPIPFNAADPTNKSLRLADDRNVHDVALSFELKHAPGTKFAYNNADSQLVGLVLERASGQRYAKYLSAKLWQPLGAGTAVINIDGKYGDARTFCCLRSQGEDWLRIGQLILNRGYLNGRQIVPALWIDEMMKPSPKNPYFGLLINLGWKPNTPKPNRAEGLAVEQREPFAADDVAYVTGAGYVNLWVIPSRGLVLLRLGSFHADYDTSVIPNMILNGLER